MAGSGRALPCEVKSGTPARLVFSQYSVLGTRYSLLALEPCRFELIALLPADELRETCRFPAQRESKPRHGCVADEVHFRMILVAWLVIVLLDVFFILRQPPRFVVTFELHSFIDRKRRNTHARQTEMIGAIKMSGLGPRIGTNRQPELFRRCLHPRIERCALGA